MASTPSLPELLESIQESVKSVTDAIPAPSSLAPPENGLSLLDVKNELLLSYLEHMVFVVTYKIWQTMAAKFEGEASNRIAPELSQELVKKMVELRLYVEKGVRPVEDKLRYQIEKALRAAETADRAQQAQAAAKADSDESASDSGSDSGSDDASDAGSGNAGMDGFDDDEVAVNRPNRAAFVRPKSGVAAGAADAENEGPDNYASKSAGAGVYKPPRIAPTLMPTTERKERKERKPLKSATMDEFIADELSTAPLAMPSIGTNIAGHGRSIKTATDRQREDERRDYEERHFVRLPKESKKDRAKRAKAEGAGPMSFGGEDWRGLGEGVDRIQRLTQRKSGGASGTRALLEKSRKRGIDTTDGPRGSGVASAAAIGERFQKRLKTTEVGRRDRGKKK